MKKFGRIVTFASFICFIAFHAYAASTVIDFDHLNLSADLALDWDSALNFRSAPYVEDGFSLTTNYQTKGMPPDLNPGQDFFVSVHEGAYFYAGSVSFITNYTEDYPILTRQGEGTFDLISMDLDSLYGSQTYLSHIQFTGVFEGGGTITKSLYLDPIGKSMETVLFPGFSGLVSVSWDDLEYVALHHFDNIVVSANTSQVPLPPTMLLLGTGITGLVMARIRIKRQ